MRILFINKRAPFDGLGAEKVIWDIAKKFASEGHEALFYCPSPTHSEIPDIRGISFEFVNTSSEATSSQIRFFLKGALTYKRVFDEFNPDLVYDNPSPFPFHLAHLYGGAPIVNKVHTIYRRLAFLAKDHPLVKVGTVLGEESYRLFRGELFTPVSQSTTDRLLRLVNSDSNRVVTNLNGTETSSFQYSFNPNSKKVLYLSKLGRKKGILELLDAWKRVERESLGASLVIAGTGPLEGKAKSRAEVLGLNNVEFKGYVSEDEKQRLFSEALIYVLPTYIEGMPLTPLEAMASGCVVVSTDTFGVSDIVENGETGILIDPVDRADLADAMIRVLSDSTLAKRLSESGRRRAEDCTTEKMLDREMEIVADWMTRNEINNGSM